MPLMNYNNNYLLSDKFNNNFSKSANKYNKEALIQFSFASHLIDQSDDLLKRSLNVLDIGCGTGFLGKKIKQKYPHINLYQIDISYPMLKIAKKNEFPSILADMNLLPLRKGKFDLIISSLCFQWGEYRKIIEQINKIANEETKIKFYILGSNSFKEIKALDYEKKFTFLPLPSLKEIEQINKEKLKNSKIESFIIKEKYPNIIKFLKNFKDTGTNIAGNKILGKNYLKSIDSRNNWPLSVSWEVLIINN